MLLHYYCYYYFKEERHHDDHNLPTTQVKDYNINIIGIDHSTYKYGC
jgi:hypothetical protein